MSGQTIHGYNVTVKAFDDFEAHETSGIPIFLDDADSGYMTPHTFIAQTGFHNFSLGNEHTSGHFIEHPPTLEESPFNAEFNLLSRGVNWIIMGAPQLPNSNAIIRFTYGSTPVVEIAQNTCAPGTVARFDVRVHMNPARTASGHLDIYNHHNPNDTSRTTPYYTTNFTLHGTQTTSIQFGIPLDAPIGTWSYIATITDFNLHATVDGSFDVAPQSAPTPANLAPAQSIPNSTFEVVNTHYVLFENPQASTTVLYVGGGTIGNIAGPEPISGYSQVANENLVGHRLVDDLVASGFSVVTPSGPWQGLDFPSQLVDYLHTRGRNVVYAIGYSAGGAVIASNLIRHQGLFEKAVIIDAPLTEEATGFYFTDLSIQAGSVQVPNLLVWGREDEQARLSNAYTVARQGRHPFHNAGHLRLWT